MRLLVASDLHVEFHKDGGQALLKEIASPDSYDVFVCAGDLADAPNLERALTFLVEAASPRPVLFVTGNHEYYGGYRKEVWATVDRVVSRSAGRLRWLEKTSTVVNGQRFLGTTLWFPRSKTAPKHELNDFRAIPGFESWVYDHHKQGVEFLRREVRATDVVVTHHLPSQKSVAPQYVGSPLNHFFVYDLEDLIVERQPKLHVHGHTHCSFRYFIGKSEICCNPFGYARHEENPEFRPDMIVEIP